ncbi:hypothetical protein AB4490_24495, partial [Vibrio cyclitrophicus]
FIAGVLAIKEQVKKNFILGFFIVPFIFFLIFLLWMSDFFQLRLIDTLDMIRDFDVSSYTGLNISTYAIGVNFDIVKSMIQDNYGMGYGFGLYSFVFDDYISNYEIPSYRENIPGRGSAVSLFLRLTAELGLFASAI